MVGEGVEQVPPDQFRPGAAGRQEVGPVDVHDHQVAAQHQVRAGGGGEQRPVVDPLPHHTLSLPPRHHGPHPAHEPTRPRHGAARAAGTPGPDRLVLGTDFPYEDGEVFLRAVDHIADSGLAPEEATMILDTNAANLLGLSAP
ncbi:amidohydrolase family protein [Streptomyces sp. NPDC058086]|uniref:amidohydrolase family protein n=1 Tax=Streptomyces sp. NPDC058086 TaxID=3346334 RepID=UPI0036E811BE